MGRFVNICVYILSIQCPGLVLLQVDSPDRAIVMEYCPMGSLFDVLQEPENYFGLDEREFLLLLDNVGQ